MPTHRFTAGDGTQLAAYKTGQTGIPVVLANGLGGTFVAWSPLVQRFSKRCVFHSWDYRGLYRSEAPADRASLTVETAVEDQLTLMRHFDLEKVLLCGWSMGVQVALEFYRRHPERVSGMILINGTYGHLFHTAFKTPLSRHVLPQMIRLAQQAAPALGPAIRRLAAWPKSVSVAATLGLVDPGIDRKVFTEVAGEFGSLDLDLYFESMLRLGEHDASDVLPNVAVPVLIVAGDRDLMTPPEVTGRMVRQMPMAELFVVPGGTHYCLLEFPDLVGLRLGRFLDAHFPTDLEQEPPADPVPEVG